jgi:hypothetical protein
MSKLSGKFELIVFILVLAIALFFFFSPTAVTRENSVEFKAMVYGVSEGSEKSVTFKLKNGRGVYYISHGLQKGLTLEALQKELINKEVTVLYLKPGKLAGFSPVADTKYITELRLGKRVVYSEL